MADVSSAGRLWGRGVSQWVSSLGKDVEAGCQQGWWPRAGPGREGGRICLPAAPGCVASLGLSFPHLSCGGHLSLKLE